jgi:hypothetical protein
VQNASHAGSMHTSAGACNTSNGSPTPKSTLNPGFPLQLRLHWGRFEFKVTDSGLNVLMDYVGVLLFKGFVAQIGMETR